MKGLIGQLAALVEPAQADTDAHVGFVTTTTITYCHEILNPPYLDSERMRRMQGRVAYLSRLSRSKADCFSGC
jgi:hypothetical protein